MSTNPYASYDGVVYGPLYLSAVLSTTFYGVTCMQTFFYYVHYPNDSRRMKLFVALMWALDTIHETLIVAGAYKYIIAGLIDPASMFSGVPELNLQMISQVLVALPAQAFLIYRIYILGGKNIIAPLLWVIPAIYQIVVAILFEAKVFYTTDGTIHTYGFTTIDDHFFMSIVTSSLSVAAAIDVLIAIAMTYLLFRMRTATGFASTAHILQRLTMFAVNTGFWTATFAVLSVVLMHVFPSNALYVVVFTPLSSLYCNTLLANLNARAYIRGEVTTNDLPAETKTEQQSAQFSPPIHLNIRKTTQSVVFIDPERSTLPKTSESGETHVF